MEKWEDINDFNFSHFCLIENGKVDGRKNIPLLKNDAQLKQKSNKQAKKKKKRSNYPNLLENKNHVKKKNRG